MWEALKVFGRWLIRRNSEAVEEDVEDRKDVRKTMKYVNRLIIAERNRTARRFEKQSAELDATKGELQETKSKIVRLEVDIGECKEDRVELHAKCETLKVQHEKCEESQTVLLKSLKELESKVENGTH